MENYELERLAEKYFKDWLKVPESNTKEGGSLVSAIKYALKQYLKENKRDGPKKKGPSK